MRIFFLAVTWETKGDGLQLLHAQIDYWVEFLLLLVFTKAANKKFLTFIHKCFSGILTAGTGEQQYRTFSYRLLIFAEIKIVIINDSTNKDSNNNNNDKANLLTTESTFKF